MDILPGLLGHLIIAAEAVRARNSESRVFVEGLQCLMVKLSISPQNFDQRRRVAVPVDRILENGCSDLRSKISESERRRGDLAFAHGCLHQ